MKLRVKKQNNDGIVRLETSGDLKEIIINEDLMDAENERVSLCFRGKSSSGIIDLTPEEIEKIYDAVKERIKIIKTFGKLSASGARLL